MRKHPKLARRLGSVVVGLVLAVYIGLPFVMATSAVWPSRADVGATPAGFRDVRFNTASGTALVGWYSRPRNGAAIILIHGAGGSRSSVERQAVMLARHGYGVLSLDLHGHGGSGGRTNRFGWEGTADVAAAVDFLEKESPGVRIGAFGSSMGGEVLLGASAECREIIAIVADGASQRSVAELHALPSERSIVHSFTPRVMYLSVGLLSGERPPAPLLGEMKDSHSTEFLLIAAGENDLEVAFNKEFKAALGSRSDLWVAPGVTHTGAYSRYPEEYERRVVQFFDTRLSPGGDTSGADASTP